MREFSRPKIVISKCIEFDHCRYNGDIIHSQAVADLKKYVDFLPVCPEVEIGLGVPRASVRIVEDQFGRKLVTGGTGEDRTRAMVEFAEKYILSLKRSEIDGFLMKTSSPSCGYRDSRVYSGIEKGSSVRKNSSGFFTETAEKILGNILFETEGRLENFNIREDFYTKIFMLAEFKEIYKEKKIKELIGFHSRNKYLLMSYSSGQLKKLGNIAANRENLEVEIIYKMYGEILRDTMKKQRRIGANINVMQHLMGYFSDKITKEEKEFFLEKIEQYKSNMVPSSVPMSILEGWVIRFGEEYLREQTIFNPYPKGLIKVTDSGKGRV